jgi:hypothetical protein
LSQLIVINDSIDDDDLVSIPFRDLLASFSPFIDQYNWSIYELDAMGYSLHPSIYADDLEKEIERSKSGYHVTGSFLIEVGDALINGQVINLLIAASKDNENFTPYEFKKEWYDKYPLVVEVVDGGGWEVYAQDPNIIKMLKNKYKNTKDSIS